jgi:hypothetical protein
MAGLHAAGTTAGGAGTSAAATLQTGGALATGLLALDISLIVLTLLFATAAVIGLLPKGRGENHAHHRADPRPQ